MLIKFLKLIHRPFYRYLYLPLHLSSEYKSGCTARERARIDTDIISKCDRNITGYPFLRKIKTIKGGVARPCQ